MACSIRPKRPPRRRRALPDTLLGRARFLPTALTAIGGWMLVSVVMVGKVAAQTRTTSAVRTTVTSTGGTPVVGAEVIVRHQGTGSARSAVTNDAGMALVLLLQPGGPYTVAVRSLGYAEFRVEGLGLQVGETTVLPVTLLAEALEIEGVEVEVDRAPVFDRSQVGPATRITERMVEDLPVLSRDVMDLALLSPLVKPTDGGGFSVAGQNDRYNAILVDGILNKDMFGLTPGGVPGGQAGAKLIPLDAISQYEVLIAPFDVRLSGFTGGVMNAVTRSGTNDWRVRTSVVHRAEALMGDLNLVSGPVEASGVDRSLAALSVGGPLARDRAHFFVAGEIEERRRVPTGYNLFRDDPALTRVSPEGIAALQTAFAGTSGGLDVGEAGPYSLGQSVTNLFGRLDWNVRPGHRLTLRNVFARATNDEEPNRSGFGRYELGSNAVYRRSSSNTTSLQLFSDVSGIGTNEFELSLTRTVDSSDPAVDWPQVEVEVTSSVDGTALQRDVRFGSALYAQDNHLAQTALRISDAFSIVRGPHVLTLGATAAWYDIDQRYLPGSAGAYVFPSLAALQANEPSRYQRTVLAAGQDPSVGFQVLEWGAFVQNRLTFRDGLSLLLGLRFDVPHFFASPLENYDVYDYFGYRTSKVPSGNVLISPRWGFNWQSDGERRTQVRAGAGMFNGQLPYIWMADALHNNGVRSQVFVCEGNEVPGFGVDVDPAGCRAQRDAVVFAEDFRFPQDLKFSIAVDRELSDRWSASLGALFSKALHQVKPQLVSSEFGQASDSAALRLGDQRHFYEGARKEYVGYGELVAPFDHVLAVVNDGEDWATSVTAELRGRLTSGLQLQVGYSLARSWDRLSLVHPDMMANFGLNAAVVDINKPLLETSTFDRPHKVVIALFGAVPGLRGSEASLVYTGQSGTPFTYVYEFDLNGDGYPGTGAAQDRFNDPVYVPEAADQLPAGIATRSLTEQLLETSSCLRDRRGEIMIRNSCRTPWQNRLDVRVAQQVRWGGMDLRLEADLINFLNLLDGSWGRIQTAPAAIPLYERGSVDFLRWSGGAVRSDAGGAAVPAPSWEPLSPDSQWQVQFGARVTFDGARR